MNPTSAAGSGGKQRKQILNKRLLRTGQNRTEQVSCGKQFISRKCK